MKRHLPSSTVSLKKLNACIIRLPLPLVYKKSKETCFSQIKQLPVVVMTTYSCNEIVANQHIECQFNNYTDKKQCLHKPLFFLCLIFAASWLISVSCGCCLTMKTSSQCNAYVICIGSMLQFPLWVCTCKNISLLCVFSVLLQLPCH